MIIFNNFLNSDFLYKCNILYDKVIRKNKIVLNETLYLAIIIYIFTKFIHNYDHKEGLIKNKNLFNVIFLFIVILYLFKIYIKFNNYKKKNNPNRVKINYYYVLIIILIVVIYLTLFNIIQQVLHNYDRNKVRRYELAVGGYNILLTASILTLFEIIFFYNIVIPGINIALNSSLSNISEKILEQYNKYKSTLDEDQDLFKIMDTVIDNINNNQNQIIDDQIRNDTINFANQQITDEMREDINNQNINNQNANNQNINNQSNNSLFGGITPPNNAPRINIIDEFSNNSNDINLNLNQEQKEFAKDIVLQLASNLGIPDDLLTDEFINYVITTAVLNTDIPERVALLDTLSIRESILTKHLNRYTFFISIIFLSILYLILSKFSKYIRKQINKPHYDIDEVVTRFHVNKNLFTLSKFSAYITILILIIFQINFYFFSKKYYLAGGLSRVEGLDKNRYGSGNEELQHLIYSNSV